MRIVTHEEIQADKRARLDAFRAAESAEEKPVKPPNKLKEKRKRPVAVSSVSMQKYTKRLTRCGFINKFNKVA